MEHEPKTLVEAIRHFSDPDVALQTMVQRRWPDGVHCPICGRANPLFLKRQRRWECKTKHERRQFSAKTGTVFEDSPLDLGMWFTAIWLLVNCKNGISSYELHRAMGVTQKSAWFMLHRIRLAMHTGSFLKNEGGSGGEYEADETFVGGLASNMHKARREKKITGTGGSGKEIIMGILRRGTVDKPSRVVRAKRVPNTTREVLHAEVKAAVERGSKLYTDSLRSYRGLGPDYEHEVVDHAVEYVRDRVHTNGLENFWNLFKRGLKGTYTHMSAVHLDKFVDEQVLRFNEREENDGKRFRIVLSSVVDKRLTYAELTGHATTNRPNA
jgi:hypothetical protein